MTIDIWARLWSVSGMARKPRIEFPGALYHVIARGNQRRRVFITPDDYQDYLSRLWSYHNKFHFIIYAYCLMPNHIHLLIEAKSAPLSQIMQRIQFSYTQSFNRRHKKVGHLFQGRYKAILCQRDEYLLQLIRYIHLNPVRAKMTNDPNGYKWSSHRALIGADRNLYCDVEQVLRLFGRKPKLAAKRYEVFVLEALGDGHREDLYQLKAGRILGDEDFSENLLVAETKDEEMFFYTVSISEIAEAVATEFSVPITLMKSLRRSRCGSFGRGMVAYFAKTIAGISMKEVGKYFKREESVIARRFRKIEEQLEREPDMQEKISKLKLVLIEGRAIHPRP